MGAAFVVAFEPKVVAFEPMIIFLEDPFLRGLSSHLRRCRKREIFEDINEIIIAIFGDINEVVRSSRMGIA
jgi:hypothetical protein